MTLEDEPPRLVGVQYATGEEKRNGKMKILGQSRNGTQFWKCLVVKVNSGAVKDNIASESGRLGP